MEGNGRDASNDGNISSSETALENDGSVSSSGCQHMSSTLCASSLNNQSSTARRSGKRWKRQRHLNNSKKWKGADGDKVLTREADKNVKSSDLDVLASGTSVECASDITGLHDSESENLLGGGAEDNEIGPEEGFDAENCSCVSFDSTTTRQKIESECCECDVSTTFTRNGDGQEDEVSSVETSKTSAYKPEAVNAAGSEKVSKCTMFATCYLCGSQVSELRYWNCADLDCNLLFLWQLNHFQLRQLLSRRRKWTWHWKTSSKC